MKNISKKHREEIEAAQSQYEEAKNALTEALDDATEKIALAISKANEKVTLVNSAIERLNNVRQEIADDIQSFIDDKSDAWRDGERGSAYSEWAESWGNEIEQISEIDESPDLNISVDDMAEEPLDEGNYPREPSV
jgi:uncharacterized protein YukE